MIPWDSWSCRAPSAGGGSRRRSVRRLRSGQRRPRRRWGWCWAPCWCWSRKCGSWNRVSPEPCWPPGTRHVAFLEITTESLSHRGKRKGTERNFECETRSSEVPAPSWCGGLVPFPSPRGSTALSRPCRCEPELRPEGTDRISFSPLLEHGTVEHSERDPGVPEPTWLRNTAVKLMPNLVGTIARPRLVHRFCLDETQRNESGTIKLLPALKRKEKKLLPLLPLAHRL